MEKEIKRIVEFWEREFERVQWSHRTDEEKLTKVENILEKLISEIKNEL